MSSEPGSSGAGITSEPLDPVAEVKRIAARTPALTRFRKSAHGAHAKSGHRPHATEAPYGASHVIEIAVLLAPTLRQPARRAHDHLVSGSHS